MPAFKEWGEFINLSIKLIAFLKLRLHVNRNFLSNVDTGTSLANLKLNYQKFYIQLSHNFLIICD